MSTEVTDSQEDQDLQEVLLKPSQGTVSFTANNGDAAHPNEAEPKEPLVLETPAEKRARHHSHYVVYVTTFVMSIGFSIVLTGVWPYLQQLDPTVSKEFLGWVIAANPLGQMLASPLLGLWGNKVGSNRGAFLTTVAIFTIGNGLYAILRVFGSSARAVMIISRFFVGVSSANIAIIRAYISSSTTLKERTTAVALTSAAQGLGFIIGPAIQTALAVAFVHETPYSSNSTLSVGTTIEEVKELRLEWNMYTATGWVGVLLGIINFLLFLPCIFQEHSVAAKEAQLQKQAAQDDTKDLPKPDYLALIGVLFSFFISLFIFVLLETLIVPMCIDMYAWSNEKAITIVGIGISLAAGLAVVMFAVLSILTRRFDERKVWIFLGLIPMALGMFLHFPVGSTYPKMKNCTFEPFHYEDFGNFTLDPFSLDVPVTTLPGEVNMTDKEINTSIFSVGMDISKEVLSTPLPEQLITTDRDLELLTTLVGEMSTTDIAAESLSIIPGGTDSSSKADPSTISPEESSNIDEMELSAVLSEESIINSGEVTETRKRRHIDMEGTCHDLGCPPEQEWCKYTPIIEPYQMAVAAFVSVIGYPVAITIAASLFSKLLGPKPQGVWMGILTSTGGFSRVAGPVCVSYLYTTMGTRWTFGVLFVLMFFTLCVVIYLYKRLLPMKITVNA